MRLDRLESTPYLLLLSGVPEGAVELAGSEQTLARLHDAGVVGVPEFTGRAVWTASITTRGQAVLDTIRWLDIDRRDAANARLHGEAERARQLLRRILEADDADKPGDLVDALCDAEQELAR